MVCLPEQAFELDDVAREVSDSYVRGKEHCIIVVAEGADPHAAAIYEHLGAQRERTGFGVRLSILGEIQHGGAPSAQDRHLATRLGSEAVRRLAAGDSGGMVGMVDGALRYTPLADVVAARRELPERELATAGMLAR